MAKFKRIVLPDGSTKIEAIRIELTKEQIEEKEKSRIEQINRDRKAREQSIKNAGCKTDLEYRNKCLIKNGYKNRTEYDNERAIKLGYSGNSERERERRYKLGINLQRYKNEDCSNYFGSYIIEEKLMKECFPYAIKMSNNNHGYDYLDPIYGKLDAKGRCLNKGYNKWDFDIYANKIADYFVLFAFNDRDNLNPLHIWLIKSDEIIIRRDNIGRKLNDRKGLAITNSEKGLRRYRKYELIDKLNQIKEICNEFKLKGGL